MTSIVPNTKLLGHHDDMNYTDIQWFSFCVLASWINDIKVHTDAVFLVLSEPFFSHYQHSSEFDILTYNCLCLLPLPFHCPWSHLFPCPSPSRGLLLLFDYLYRAIHTVHIIRKFVGEIFVLLCCPEYWIIRSAEKKKSKCVGFEKKNQS